MAIPVKNKLGQSETVNSYSIFVGPVGLTTTGSVFVQDTETLKYYVYNDFTSEYVELGGSGSYQELVNSNKELNIRGFRGDTIDPFLDQTAREYGYQTIHDAISYYNSGITAWRNEAIAFNTWRDNTQNLMFQNIHSYTADGITLPTLSGFTGQVGYVPLGLTSPSRPSF